MQNKTPIQSALLLGVCLLRNQCQSVLIFLWCNFRDCQKDDWPKHRKHCGKQKISKKLKGTAEDPIWRFPELEPVRHSFNPDGNVNMSKWGFGPPSAASWYSPDLQQQVALLRFDREADYILFDTRNYPVRYVIPESDAIMKLSFRLMRTMALTDPGFVGLGGMADIIVKDMSRRPGLSERGIIAQLQREYGVRNLEEEIAKCKQAAVARGWDEGTFMQNTMKTLGNSDYMRLYFEKYMRERDGR